MPESNNLTTTSRKNKTGMEKGRSGEGQGKGRGRAGEAEGRGGGYREG